MKSGGEWISSVDLEILMMRHPDVVEAAVIAVPHPRWDGEAPSELWVFLRRQLGRSLALPLRAGT